MRIYDVSDCLLQIRFFLEARRNVDDPMELGLQVYQRRTWIELRFVDDGFDTDVAVEDILVDVDVDDGSMETNLNKNKRFVVENKVKWSLRSESEKDRIDNANLMISDVDLKDDRDCPSFLK